MTAAPLRLRLLDGGVATYAAMLRAIGRAERDVDLVVYSFAADGTGARFEESLVAAAARGVQVRVVVDGWGSLRSAPALAARLMRAGCSVTVHNRLRRAVRGALDRNHRKILAVDDRVAFFGGINIGDEFIGTPDSPPWLDVAVELRGQALQGLAESLHRSRPEVGIASGVVAHLSGAGGGFRLQRRYIEAVEAAERDVVLAHAYFLPHRSFLRALLRAAKRGVRVRALLPGRSDVPFATLGTRRLYRRMLRAGIEIREWSRSPHHAKLCCVDGERLLIGSFNLDPLSLVNRESLLDIERADVTAQAEAWAARHLAVSKPVTADACRSAFHRCVVEPVGEVLHRSAEVGAKLVLGARPVVGRRQLEGPWTP